RAEPLAGELELVRLESRSVPAECLRACDAHCKLPAPLFELTGADLEDRALRTWRPPCRQRLLDAPEREAIGLLGERKIRDRKPQRRVRQRALGRPELAPRQRAQRLRNTAQAFAHRFAD